MNATTGGVLLPDLSDRVDELARQVEELRSAPQDTIGTTNTIVLNARGEVEGALGMEWLRDWDAQAAYEPGDTVRYRGRSFVCIAPVAEKPFALGSISRHIAEKVNPITAKALLTPESPFASGRIRTADPKWQENSEGGHAKCYEFLAAGGTVTVPRVNADPNTFLALFESTLEEGKYNKALAAGSNLTLNKVSLVGAKSPFYIVVSSTQQVAFELEVIATNMTGEGLGNLPPSSDEEHWDAMTTALGTAPAIAYRKAEQALAAVTFNVIKLDTAISDPVSCLDLVNGAYVTPFEGWYQVNGNTACTAPADYVTVILVNGVEKARGSRSVNAAAAAGSVASGIVFCKRGDQIQLAAYTEKAGKTIEAGSSFVNQLSVARVG